MRSGVVMHSFLSGKLVLVALLAVLLMTACPQPPPAEATIGEIRAASASYEGKTVTVEGFYQGWQGGYGSPPVTRSDWLVEDATGWLYVTGKPAGNLDPLDDIGCPIKVTGQVELTGEGEPYLVAGEVEIEATKATSLLLMQLNLRRQQLAHPTPERLEQMQAMGMNTEELEIQRIFIHLAQEPTAEQLKGLEAMGITPYPDSWIPSAQGPSDGFMAADMPLDKLDELTSKAYIIKLDSAEQPSEPLD
jgi:hypothetical protein